jgi:hypothetical protein
MGSTRKLQFIAMSILAMTGCTAWAQTVFEVGGRLVEIGPATQIRVDGEVLPPGSPLPRKAGLRMEVVYPPDARRGVVPEPAQTLVFSYALRGPVTSLAPLRVLGQELGINGDTHTVGIPGGTPDTLELGDEVEVSGYVDDNASLLATFLEFSPEPLGAWLLSGHITSVNAGNQQAMLGPQRISTAGVPADGCGTGLAVGQFVEIRAEVNAGFGPESLLEQITSLTCVTPMPIGTPGALGALGGLIGEILAPDRFRFGPYEVVWDAATEFRFGAADDIALGAEVEIDGVFGADLIFNAQGIQFGAPIIRLEAPVMPADVVSGPDGTVTLLGFTVQRIAQLRDRDAIYASGLSVPTQVEIRGYRDSAGKLFATRARERGDPDLNDVRVGGPVSAVDAPELTVLGITLDTTGAVFEGPDELPIDAAAFFAAAGEGAMVEQTGTYDPVARRLSGGVMTLVLGAPPAAVSVAGATLPVEVLVGPLGDLDRIHLNGFE